MEASTIKSMIQCPFCFAIPTNKKFFSCKNSHKICEHCFGRLASLVSSVKSGKTPPRVKCPQGDCDYTDPPFRNLEIEEMIRNYELEVNCKYYHDGCMVTGVRSGMADHEIRCGCREVPCPNSECGLRLQLRLLLGHIKDEHKDSLIKEDTDNEEEFTLTCLLKDEFQKREDDMGRLPPPIWTGMPALVTNTRINEIRTEMVSTWITIIWNHRNGQTFFPMFEKKNGAWYAWIFLQGIQEDADRWEGIVRVRDPGRKAVLEFRGPVYSVDITGAMVMTKGKCLAMSDRQVEMMKSEDGLKDDERDRGFNSKIVISYDVHLLEGDAFT